MQIDDRLRLSGEKHRCTKGSPSSAGRYVPRAALRELPEMKLAQFQFAATIRGLFDRCTKELRDADTSLRIRGIVDGHTWAQLTDLATGRPARREFSRNLRRPLCDIVGRSHPVRTNTISRIGLVALLPAAVWLIAYLMRPDYSRLFVVESENWPRELKEIVSTANDDAGLVVDDIDVRSVGITTYCWRLSSQEYLVRLHIERFQLEAVANDGVEYRRLLRRWPRAWAADVPAHKNIDCYAYPPGLPGAQDGESEYVMLHDKTTKKILFNYYFN